LVIPAPGTLKIIFIYDQKELGIYEIEVHKIGQPEIKQQPDVATEPIV